MHLERHHLVQMHAPAAFWGPLQSFVCLATLHTGNILLVWDYKHLVLVTVGLLQELAAPANHLLCMLCSLHLAEMCHDHAVHAVQVQGMWMCIVARPNPAKHAVHSTISSSMLHVEKHAVQIASGRTMLHLQSMPTLRPTASSSTACCCSSLQKTWKTLQSRRIGLWRRDHSWLACFAAP